MKTFAATEQFVSDVSSRKLKPGYVFIGDEAFFRRQCRDAVLQHLVPQGMREFSFYEFDLESAEVAEVLDRARTPSLMVPFQVFFVEDDVVTAPMQRLKQCAERSGVSVSPG